MQDRILHALVQGPDLVLHSAVGTAAEQLQAVNFLPCPLWMPCKDIRWKDKEARGHDDKSRGRVLTETRIGTTVHRTEGGCERVVAFER